MTETRAIALTEAERSFLSAAQVRAHEPQWLAEARGEALRAFEAEGLPDRKVEAFHFTDLKTLLRAPYPPLAGERGPKPETAKLKALAKSLSARVIPIVNGVVVVESAVGRELQEGVEILPLGESIARTPEIARFAFEGDVGGRAKALRALNTGLARDGAVIRVRRDEQARLIVLHHSADLNDRGSLHLRHLIVLEAGAEASVLEIFEGDGDYLTTTETLIHLGANARLAHAKLVKDSREAVHLGRSDLRAASGADYRLFVLGAGARLAREELAACFEGESAHVGVAGVLLLKGEQHFDLTARIDHTAARCSSDMDARAALAGHAKGIVQGSVRVAPDAQHTDARQLIRGLLLSPRAEFDSKPELEILADDVKCSHGAASGDLDADSIFYLRARGIPERQARALLIEAFLEEGFAKVEGDAVRTLLSDEAHDWLQSLTEARDG